MNSVLELTKVECSPGGKAVVGTVALFHMSSLPEAPTSGCLVPLRRWSDGQTPAPQGEPAVPHHPDQLFCTRQHSQPSTSPQDGRHDPALSLYAWGHRDLATGEAGV